MEHSIGRKNRAVVILKAGRLLCVFWLAAISACAPASAFQEWEVALSTMPLGAPVAELNSSNAVQVMLGALESNAVVKGLVFMPGATDEFYFFHRARARLSKDATTLLDAVNALQSQTRIRARFRAPLLLLHTDEDQLEPDIQAEGKSLIERIRSAQFVPHALFNDRDWDYIQPILRKCLKVEVLPAKYSSDSWHFYRHSFAAWNLNGWETLEALVFAGKSRCSIQKQGGLSLRRTIVIFQEDRRLPPAIHGTVQN